MSKKKLGCALILDDNNKLTGLLTDGDIRRILLRYPDVSVLNNRTVMTKNPKVISPDAMATEAVKLMQDKKITNIFAVKDGKPVGVIHIHDCLSSGIL